MTQSACRIKRAACTLQYYSICNIFSSPSAQFAVHYKYRNNSALKRDDVIKLLACMVTKNGEFSHTVDLTNPDLTVMVEVVKVHNITVHIRTIMIFS